MTGYSLGPSALKEKSNCADKFSKVVDADVRYIEKMLAEYVQGEKEVEKVKNSLILQKMET
jgi:hypothetical protein